MIERKTFHGLVKESSEEDLTVVHFISTETPDRTGDVMLADGMRIVGRPVVLFQHGHGPMGTEPIARPVWIRVAESDGRKGILAKTQFYPDELGKRLWDKTAHGWMPNWSIGYRVLKSRDLGRDTRLVEEWELLEYSPVAVPMNPEATGPVPEVSGSEIGGLLFKMLPIPEEEAKAISQGTEIKAVLGEDAGPIGSWKMLVLPDLDEKPYRNEHACRLEEPGKYERIRRENNKFGDGIHAIWGVPKDGGSVELQAIRFSADKFTADKARKWLADHDYKCKLFEPAADREAGGATEEKSVIPYKRTPLAPEDTPWDAAQEVAKASVDDLKIMCVWYDSENPDLKTSYKGPHHKADGEHACVWNGVRALAAVVMGARGGMKIPAADLDKVKAHVAGHYKDFDKGDPPWKKEAYELYVKAREHLREADADRLAANLFPELAEFFFLQDGEKTIKELVGKVETLTRQVEALAKRAANVPGCPGQEDAGSAVASLNVNPPEDDWQRPAPRLVFVREEGPSGTDQREALKALARQTVGEHLRREIRRMLGKVD